MLRGHLKVNRQTVGLKIHCCGELRGSWKILDTNACIRLFCLSDCPKFPEICVNFHKFSRNPYGPNNSTNGSTIIVEIPDENTKA